MTQSGRVDYDQVARAQAMLLTRHRLTSSALVAAYRTVRTATPGAYTEPFVKALLSHGHTLRGEEQVEAWKEAVDIARRAAEADPRNATVLVEALTKYQHGLCDAGRHAEGLEACREMALVGKRAYDRGMVPSPTFASWPLACRLAESGEHAEAAALFEAILRDDTHATGSDDFWKRMAWIAETEAAGQDTTARDALQELVDEHRQHADRRAGGYAYLIWERLLLASMDREHGREFEAERCDVETEALLTMLAANGEPENWGDLMAVWFVLISLTGRSRARPGPDGVEPPLFSDFVWAPQAHRDYLSAVRDRLQSEVTRLAKLAEQEPSLHLSELVEVQRGFTLSSVKHWRIRSRRVPDELRPCFDEGVRCSRRLLEVDEPAGRSALARALTDRTSMHVAARDFPSALRDFQQARRAAAGGVLV